MFGQGEDWAAARRAVQQDMMRPQSALFYIEELTDTADELCDKEGPQNLYIREIKQLGWPVECALTSVTLTKPSTLTC